MMVLKRGEWGPLNWHEQHFQRDMPLEQYHSEDERKFGGDIRSKRKPNLGLKDKGDRHASKRFVIPL